MKIQRTVALLGLLLVAMPLFPVGATTDVEGNVPHVIYIECGYLVDGVYTAVAAGSGVAVDESVVITNAHVVADEEGYYYDVCYGGRSYTTYLAPVSEFILEPALARWNDYFDYAFMVPVDEDGEAYLLDSYAVVANADSMVFNEYLYALGYPSVGGSTITVTEGTISGFSGTNWIKSSVVIEHGNSGGGAFDVNGNLFGIPTSVIAGELNSISYIQNINAIIEDAFGAEDAVRDYETIYSTENVFCVYDECYQFAQDEDSWASEVEISDDVTIEEEATVGEDDVIEELVYTVPDHAMFTELSKDTAMQSRVKGYILLQVEQYGEAWYVNTTDSLRYYMRDGAIAYQMMRSFGLGITDADLDAIPSVDTVEAMTTATSVCATNNLANRVRGQILLQVEQHGEAWYVHPGTCRRIYMKDGDVAYETMRYLSLGITDVDLAKLPYSTTMEFK